MKTKNFIFIILLIFIVFALSSQTALAQDRGRPLEVRYPNVPSADLIPQETTTPVPEYVQYIYYFLLGLSGIIALGVLIYAGFQYFTSVGNPEKINEAKDRIAAALLGLLILIGSYVILYNINPDLVSFNLPLLRPTIPGLPSGVILCKRDAPVYRAWELTEEYYTEPSLDRQRQIRNELKILLKEIALYCYSAQSSGDISQEFDNKATVIYFVPSYSYYDGAWHSTEYGAVIYEDTGLQGTSHAYLEHLLDPDGRVQVYSDSDEGNIPLLSLGIKPSSIIPFKLIYEPDPDWNVTLYKDLNYNDGVAAEEDKETLPDGAPPGFRLSPGIWWDYFVYGSDPWSPKSMKTEGDLLVVLETSDHKSESFFSQEVPNLEAYDNIIEWGRCESYEGERERGGEWRGWAYIREECAHAATTAITYISAEKL